MVGSVICFSIMDICVKWLDYYPIGQVLFLRFFIGFIPIFFIIPKDKLFSFYKTSRPWLHTFRAICGALAIIALFFGLRVYDFEVKGPGSGVIEEALTVKGKTDASQAHAVARARLGLTSGCRRSLASVCWAHVSISYVHGAG